MDETNKTNEQNVANASAAAPSETETPTNQESATGGAESDALKDKVVEAIKTCFDPEIPVNIVDLGLIYRCDISKREDGRREVAVDMTLTAPGCGMGEILVADVREKLAQIPTLAETRVELVFDPPWEPGRMSDEARLQTGMF